MPFRKEFSLYKLYIAHLMKLYFIKGLFLVFAFGFSSVAFGQSKVSEAERKDLEFQDCFFEALKQRAILNYSKAVDNLEKCSQLKDENVAVLFEFSKNYLLMERYFEATIFIDKSIRMEPDNVDLLRHKVNVFSAQQEFEKAVALQKKVVELKPIYRTELAQIYIQNENYDLAEEELKGAINDGDASVHTGYYLNFLERRKKQLEGESKPVEVLGSDATALRSEFQKSNDFNVLKQLLEQDLIYSDYDNLLNDSQEGLDLFPAQPLMYAMNAMALNGMGKYNDALVVLSIGEDFIVENSKIQLDFYTAYLEAYRGLNDGEMVGNYELKIEKLRKELND